MKDSVCRTSARENLYKEDLAREVRTLLRKFKDRFFSFGLIIHDKNLAVANTFFPKERDLHFFRPLHK